MSAHDYMSRSGYAEDAYSDHPEKFPVVDVEGRRRAVSDYGRSPGTRTYVRKVESYVQEIRKSKPAYSSVTMGFPSKESGSFNSDGRPREVHDFLMKILTEVNGPPHKTSDPNLGTNQGEHNFSHEPPARTSAPNLERVDVHEVHQRFGPYGTSQMKVDPTSGPPVRPSDPTQGRGRYIFPVKEEIRDNYGDGHRYGSSLTKAEPTMHYGYECNGSPRKSEKDHNNQWGQSSSPDYDHQPQGGYGVPNRQGAGYGLNSNAPRSLSPIYSHPPQMNNQLPHDKWGNPLKSQTQDYGAPNNSSPRKPSSFKDCEVQNHGRGGSPVKLDTPYGYGVSPNNTYAAKPEKPKEYKIPDSQWGNPETRDHGVRSNKWDTSSNPIHDHPRGNTKKQLGGSTMNSRGNGLSGNQWDRSSSPIYSHPGNNPSSPKNQWGSSWVQTQSPGNYGDPSNQNGKSSAPIYSHPQNNPLSPQNQWERSSVKTQSPGNYGVPNSQQSKSSNPVYDHPQNNSSRPKNQLESSLVKTESPGNYGVPNNRQGKSSTPVYNHPQNPPSGPKDQWGSSPVKTQSPGDYGATVNQLGRSSSPVYDHLRNNPSGPKDPLGSSPVKTQSPKGYGLSSNQWNRASSPPNYDHLPKNKQHQPPQVTCRDGVCTLNNKPRAPHSAYDEPKGDTNRFPITKPASYYDDQYRTDGLRSKPYSPDHQPKDFGTSTNQMMPSGYNSGEALAQLNLDARTPPEGGVAAIAGKSSAPVGGFSGPRKLTIPPPVGPIRETMVVPGDIDSEQVVRLYGGCSIPYFH